MAAGKKTGGRVKGTPNKATKEAREAFRRLVDGNSHRLQRWLDRIARDRPDKALELFMTMAEFVIPKLSRAELTGPGGDRLIVEIKHFGETDGETHSG